METFGINNMARNEKMLKTHEKRYIISKSPYMNENQTYRWLGYLKGQKLKVSQKADGRIGDTHFKKIFDFK